MNAEVEQRIVEMRFDNEQFEKGAKQTLGTLEKLDKILDILGEGGMDHLSSALSTMEYRFSRLGIAGSAAIQNITGKVMNLASNLLTAIPDQIVQGGTQRALNIENAKFQLKGLGIAWEEVADDIDHAVMGTAYGVDEAAKAAAILGASNVQYKNMAGEISDMGHVLRSISGIAAMTNSSYDDIANVMGDIFAMGRVTNGELQRFELRGLNVVAKLAEMSQNGTLKKIGSDAKYTETELRELIRKGGIDALTFAKAMDAAFGEHATAANETYTGSLRNMKAALSRIGADFVAPFHEGERKVMLSLRGAFDRIRKITKPFAEGTFTKTVEFLSEKAVKLIDSLEFKGLKDLFDILNKFNPDSFTKLLKGAKDSSSLDKVQKKLRGIMNVLSRITGIIRDFSFSMIGKSVRGIADILGTNLLRALDRVYGAAMRFEDSRFRRFLSNEIGPRLEKIGTILRSLGATGRAVGEVIFAVFTRIFSFLQNSGTFSAFGKGFDSLSDFIIKASDSLRIWLERLRDFIKDGPSAESSLGRLSNGFELIGGFVSGAVNAISTFLKYLLGIKEGETVFTKFGGAARSVGGIIRSVFGNIRDAIRGVFGEGGVGKDAIKIASALYTVLLGYRQWESKEFAFGRLGRSFTFLKDLLSKVYTDIRALNPLQWADDIETLLRRTGGALRAFSDNLNAKSLIAIGGAVVTLAFGLSLLAAVAESGNIESAFAALVGVMGVLIVSLTAIKAVTSQGLFKDIAKGWKGLFDVFKNGITKYFDAIALKETATALLIFSAAVGVLALAVVGLGFAFKHLSLGDIILAVVTVGALTALLTGMLVWITKATKEVGMFDSSKFMMIAAAFIGMALAVDLLALAVAGLTAVFNGSNVWAAIGAVGTIIVLLGALVGAMVLLNMWTKEIGGAKLMMIGVAMIAMALAVDLLALAVAGLAYAFNGLDSVWPVIGAVVAVGAMLIAMAGTLAFLSSMLEKVPIIKILAVSAALVLMSGAILIVAAAALGFATAMQMSEKWWHVLATMVGILAAMAVALGVLSLLGPQILIAAGAILAVGFAIKIACDGFIKLAEGMVVLSGALNMLPADGSLEIIGKGLGKVAGGLGKIAAAGLIFPRNLGETFEALIPLATAMTVMSELDFEQLADKDHGMPAAAKAIKSFGGLFGVGMAFLWGTSGLVAAGPGLSSLGVGLQALTPGLQAFSTIENPEGIAEIIKELAVAVTTLGADSTFGNRDYLPQLAENLTKIAGAVGSLSSDQVEAIRGLGSALSTAFTDSSGAAVSALQSELNQLQQTLETGSAQFITVARRFPMHIQSGIEDNTPIAKNAMKKLIWEMCEAANSDEVKNNLRIIGGNIAIGIANGISSRTAEAANAMRNLAGALQKSFTVSLQIHSPSRLFEHLAEYIPQGVARGIQNGTPEITAAMAESMTGAMDVLDQYARQTGSMTPRISPVMNMTDMRRDFSYMDQMFQRSGIGSFSGFSGLTVNGDAISYNMQNRDVVGELKQMSNKINRLGQAIENMKMVLDTGVLVGQLSPGINSELGIMAMREGRQ